MRNVEMTEKILTELNIRTSSLDEAQNFPPQAHVFTKSKVDWIHLDNKIPSFEIWYDRDKVWPQASLDRLSGLF